MSTQIAVPLPTVYLEAVTNKARKPRSQCALSTSERNVINKYREEYRSKTTTEERTDVLRNNILVDIFNHWFNQGVVTADINADDLSERIKNLSIWIRNNWRSFHTVNNLPKHRKKSRLDVLWHQNEEVIMDELRVILKEKGRTDEPNKNDIFKYRTTAAKRVYDRLSPEEQTKIDIECINDIVSPPDVQRRRAVKLGAKIVSEAASKNWKDMGLYALTFYGYVRPNGVVAVEMHDRMAVFAGIRERRFIDIYSDQVDEIQRHLFEYIKLLLSSTPIQTDTTCTQRARPDLIITTKDGYPWIPPVLDDVEQKKDELETLLRQYLNMHYKLASGNRKFHVPFGKLCDDSQKFIHSKYLPAKFIWKDPRNLTKDTILQFCDHIRTRQDNLGASEGLRFHAYFDGEDMVPAIYEVQDDRRAAAKAQKHQAAAGTQKHQAAAGTQKQQAAQADKRASGPQKGKEKEIRATSISDAQIDPTLLTGEDSMTNMNNVNQTTHNDSGEFIQESDMQLLMNNGYPSTLPANGPNEGLPHYYVTAAGIHLLKRLKDNTRMTTRSQVNQRQTNN